MGGTWLGLLFGLIFGLAIAVVVAVYVNHAPVPFLNKTGRAPEHALVPNGAATPTPDPNRPLYAKDAPMPPALAANTPELADNKAADPAVDANADPIGALLAKQAKTASAQEQALAQPVAASKHTADVAGASYFLQAGAFRSQEDAESVRVKITLSGLDVKVTPAEINGNSIYRVRVGPYSRLDDMNRARSKLAENGIEVSVVKEK